MAYRCEICDIPQPARTPCYPLAVETREKTYTTFNKKTKRTKVSKGHEVVREIKCCPKCFRKATAVIKEGG